MYSEVILSMNEYDDLHLLNRIRAKSRLYDNDIIKVFILPAGPMLTIIPDQLL